MASHPLAPTWLRVDVDANELVPGVWASSVTRNSAGEVLVAGAHVSALAPVYLVVTVTSGGAISGNWVIGN